MNEELKKVVEAGIRSLAYSSHTERQMYEKLRMKGYKSAAAQAAVEYLKEKGYINDADYVDSAILKLAERKFYGKSRIKAELSRMGFSSEVIREADFSGVDFHANCCKVVLKRGDPNDFEDRDKAYVRSLGYSTDEIRAALKELRENE